jgi:alpha-mannosidase
MEELMSQTREWHVYVLPSMHQDISYMKSAEEDLALFNSEYLKYLDLMDQEPTWCYSSEFAFAVRNFLEQHPDQRERLTRWVRAGRFGITAQCSGFDPSFYSGEFVIREIAVAKDWLDKTFGYAPRTLHLADVPDFAPQLPQILAGCEVDLFLCDRAGSGEGQRGNVLHIGEFPGMWELLDNEVLKSLIGRMGVNREIGEYQALYPHYWAWKGQHKDDQPINRLWKHIGLDGTPVLAYAPSMRYYGLCGLQRRPGEMQRNPRFDEEAYLSNLNPATEPDYTALGIVGFDEEEIEPRIVVERVAAWNREQRAQRKINLDLSTAERFTAEMVEAVASGRIKVGEYSGITPGWHYANYDDDDRAWVQNQLLSTELLASLNTLLGTASYPTQALEQAWQILWAISHNQLGDPSFFRTLRASVQAGRSLLRRSLGKLTAAVKPARSSQPLLVFNPLNWSRSERVTVTVPGESVSGIVDSTGRPVAYTVQSVDADSAQITVELLAKDVPGIGYRTFYIEPAEPAASDLTTGDNWIQNSHYHIAVDGAGYLHLTDRTTGQELAGISAASGPARLVGQGRRGELPWKTIGVEVDANSLKATLRLSGILSRSSATLSLTLTADQKRIDWDIDLDWDGERGARVYLPLPFSYAPDELRLGVACGHVPYFRPTAPALLRHAPLSKRSAKTTFSTYWYFPLPHEPIPGDDFSWAYMQKWAYLGATSGGVTLASGRRNGLIIGDGMLAIPLLSTPSRRAKHVRQRRIYGKGHHHWHLALTTTSDLAEAAHLGWSVSQPLQATTEWQPGGQLEDTLQLIHLAPQQAIWMALKRSFNNDGWVARFFEATDQDGEVQFKLHPALHAEGRPLVTANMLERPGEAVPQSPEGMRVALHGFEIKTLLWKD